MFGSAASGRPFAPICSSASSATSRPPPWLAPIAATSSLPSRSAASRGVTPASVSAPSSNVISATIGSADTARTAADRVHELLQVVERLDHEQVGAASLEHARLLAAEVLTDPRGRRFAERPDRTADEDVPARDLPRLAGQLDGSRVDPLELVLEEVVGQLAAVRAERVGLDQLGAGVDEADV